MEKIPADFKKHRSVAFDERARYSDEMEASSWAFLAMVALTVAMNSAMVAFGNASAAILAASFLPLTLPLILVAVGIHFSARSYRYKEFKDGVK
ncbi:MAG: hypothetical protein RLZZ283_126 [Candidatus Parcubacteria bacterium]|jgi:ABC-type Fe3+ transport system permease subunit